MLLQSDRIFLRAVEPSDATILFAWENAVTSWKVSGTEVPFSLHTIQQYIETAQNFRETGQLRLMICLCESNEAIGCVDFFEADFKHGRAGVGILLADDAVKGMGYASESLSILIEYAKEMFDFHVLHCTIEEDNLPSIRLFETTGFELVGILKEWNKRGKERVNLQMYQYLLK
jgi:diamine N-acetyltransferase